MFRSRIQYCRPSQTIDIKTLRNSKCLKYPQDRAIARRASVLRKRNSKKNFLAKQEDLCDHKGCIRENLLSPRLGEL